METVVCILVCKRLCSHREGVFHILKEQMCSRLLEVNDVREIEIRTIFIIHNLFVLQGH